MVNQLVIEAERFIRNCYGELQKSKQEIEARIDLIKQEISETRTYEHTFEELEHGAKMAWRNSNRCIGRLFWDSLTVFDARGLQKTCLKLRFLLTAFLHLTRNLSEVAPSFDSFSSFDEKPV